MEFEDNNYEEKGVPVEALKIIEKSIAMDLSFYSEEDIWTAEQDEETELLYKKAQYLLLDWLKRTRVTDTVLYAGSGSDLLPKYVFGEEKVAHTSMEGYGSDNKKYFPELGSGVKVVADNVALPFPGLRFDMVLFFGLSTGTTKDQLREASRVLRNGGLVVCDNIVSCDINLEKIFPGFETIEVPKYIQNNEESELNFFVLRKPS
jgi:SAM-dependent methyltransferase